MTREEQINWGSRLRCLQTHPARGTCKKCQSLVSHTAKICGGANFRKRKDDPRRMRQSKIMASKFFGALPVYTSSP